MCHISVSRNDAVSRILTRASGRYHQRAIEERKLSEILVEGRSPNLLVCG